MVEDFYLFRSKVRNFSGHFLQPPKILATDENQTDFVCHNREGISS